MVVKGTFLNARCYKCQTYILGNAVIGTNDNIIYDINLFLDVLEGEKVI